MVVENDQMGAVNGQTGVVFGQTGVVNGQIDAVSDVTDTVNMVKSTFSPQTELANVKTGILDGQKVKMQVKMNPLVFYIEFQSILRESGSTPKTKKKT